MSEITETITVKDGQAAVKTVAMSGSLQPAASATDVITVVKTPDGAQAAVKVFNLGGGGGSVPSEELEALNNAVSVLRTSEELASELGASTTVLLEDLFTLDIDGRPDYKAAGATVYAENGVVGIIDTVNETTQAAIIKTVSVSSEDTASITNHGIKGDYCSTYGITDMPNGVITSPVDNNNLIIPAGIVLKAAGSDTLTTLASSTTHETTSTSDFTLFYAEGEFIECGEVYYSATEPSDNGVENYQAWFSPSLGKWKFRSVNDGNVWREAVATPLCDCLFTDGNIVRIDFIGYRVLNKQDFATKAEVGNIAGVLDAINGESV